MFLSLALKNLPLGTAYAIWTGIVGLKLITSHSMQWPRP
nr:SMR family transporter [Sporotomaculum syntrophicum]